MALFSWMSKAEIRKRYTHVGWMLFCPVYFAIDGETLDIVERNGVPVWLFWMVGAIQGEMLSLLSLLDPEFEPGWMVLETGKIQGARE